MCDSLSEVSSFEEVQRCLISQMRYRLPYLDHCYAAELPGFSEDEMMEGTPDLIGALIDIEDISSNTIVAANVVNKDLEKKVVDEYEGSVTRCICDFQHDDGFMISCDRCCVWQHVDCMGLEKSNIPESYLCELCQPRYIDKKRAVRLQIKKREEIDSSSGESEEGQTSKKDRKRKGRCDEDDDYMESTSGKIKRKKKKSLSSDAPTENIYLKPYCCKRPRLDSESRFARYKDAHHEGSNVTIDHSSEEMQPNIYSDKVSLLLSTTKDSTFLDNDNLSTQGLSFDEQLTIRKFSVKEAAASVKAVVALSLIRSNSIVAEYLGNVMTLEEYEKSENYDITFSSVLCHTLQDGPQLCVDARERKHPIKHIRSSCQPNTKVTHIIQPGLIRIFIYATQNISGGKEITIPFSFNYQKCDKKVVCVCGRSNCAVTKFYKARNNLNKAHSSNPNTTNSSQASKRLSCLDSGLTSHFSPLSMPLSTSNGSSQPSLQENVYNPFDINTCNSEATHLFNTSGLDTMDSSRDSFDSSDVLCPLVIAELPPQKKRVSKNLRTPQRRKT